MNFLALDRFDAHGKKTEEDDTSHPRVSTKLVVKSNDMQSFSLDHRSGDILSLRVRKRITKWQQRDREYESILRKKTFQAKTFRLTTPFVFEPCP